jgi:D-alanyl-D-alanine endopeptidase (penicillin-binding protein 7)
MQARVAGRKLIMVFLDSAGKLSRLGDAERVRRWLEKGVAAHHGPAEPSMASRS